MRRTFLPLLPALLLLCGPARGNEDCLACHADRDRLAEAQQDPNRPLEPLLVDRARFAKSVHSAQACADCHFDYDAHPHPADAESVSCTECHEEAGQVLAKSIHGQAKEGEPRLPVSCGSCHGVHDVLRPSDRESKLHPLNVYRVCGQCHFDVDPAEADVDTLLEQEYTDDTHARGILEHGLTVSATCVSCHGSHAILGEGDPESTLSHGKIADTCGKCHVGVVEQYRRSVHFEHLGDEERPGPTCTDCHQPHEIDTGTSDFRTQSIRACSNCHDERGGSFRLTFHGKASALGFGDRIATCDSCHGNHEILPASNPLSPVHESRIVDTCGKCHEGANEQFADYMVHADPRDGENYPKVHIVWLVMTGLLTGVLILGGLHALLWLVRSTAAGEWKRPAVPREARRYYRRWPRSYVVYHIWMMVTVLVLATTGLPLHYADKGWSRNIMAIFGGPFVTGYIHRVGAVSLGLLFLVYIGDLVRRVFVRKEKGLFAGPNSMTPRWKDAQDLWGNVRWFLFLAPRPKYDRWTYWEKFDFWAAFWGLFVIGFTGLMLWFPEWFTQFMPGWFLNAAVVIHGIEALLDIAFIFTVHVFHANLRPDKFPMDTMFLTGRITEEEFRHERPVEWERLKAAGRLEERLDVAPPRRTRIAAYILGTAALAVGFFFVAMMLVALLQNAN